MTRTKLSIDDLRTQLAVRLAVAPQYWFKALWQPKVGAGERDNIREKLVAHITQGWDSLEIEAETTHGSAAHSVPPTK